jgi:hypothetical protein
MDQIACAATKPTADWLWHGYLARSRLMLLTSLWKAGKTTFLTGLFATAKRSPAMRHRSTPWGRAGPVIVWTGATDEQAGDIDWHPTSLRTNRISRRRITRHQMFIRQ